MAAVPGGIPALGRGAGRAAGERRRGRTHAHSGGGAVPAPRDAAFPLSQVSRGLRTPRLPLWLCSLRGRHGVLFGTDGRLLSDWRRERVFHLYFYNGQRKQAKTAHLTIGTHPRAPGQGRSGGCHL